eukprot:6837144-Lingulodinium_polyedra.AAC.1
MNPRTHASLTLLYGQNSRDCFVLGDLSELWAVWELWVWAFVVVLWTIRTLGVGGLTASVLHRPCLGRV